MPALGDLSRDRYNIWTMLGGNRKDERYKEMLDARRQYQAAVMEDSGSLAVPFGGGGG